MNIIVRSDFPLFAFTFDEQVNLNELQRIISFWTDGKVVRPELISKNLFVKKALTLVGYPTYGKYRTTFFGKKIISNWTETEYDTFFHSIRNVVQDFLDEKLKSLCDNLSEVANRLDTSVPCHPLGDQYGEESKWITVSEKPQLVIQAIPDLLKQIAGGVVSEDWKKVLKRNLFFSMALPNKEVDTWDVAHWIHFVATIEEILHRYNPREVIKDLLRGLDINDDD